MTLELPRSVTTARSVALVEARKPAAVALGRSLAVLIHDPDAFARALSQGLAGLADPEYRDGQRRVAPGIGRIFGVRWPLISAVERGFREAIRGQRPTGSLEIADRLFREPELEPRWFAFGLLDRLLAVDPERTWQLLRRAAREADDWITVDSLARPVGRGVLLEPYRWAELEQLVFSPLRWERRLVGSTVATMPFVDRRVGREAHVARRGLGLIGGLIGDRDPDVQKALAWALRSLTLVDAAAVAAFVGREADRAAATRDGHRAWVLRDTLSKLPPDVVARTRQRLAGVRRSTGAPATSDAAALAARFSGGSGLPDPRILPEPPL
jgi:3-methyladenine DNA glycosylase AlkD